MPKKNLSQVSKRQPVKNRLPLLLSKFSTLTINKKNRLILQLALPLALIILSMIGTVYFSNALSKPVNLEPVSYNNVPIAVANTEEPVAQKNNLYLDRSEPTRLKINKIGLDSPVGTVGKNADKTIEVPKSTDLAGWYRYSPTPGELGPAIIVGHVDSYKGPAIFWRLRELVPGDVIEVSRTNGTPARFKVDAVKQFSQKDFPTQEVYGNIDHAGIRLITCGGVYDRNTNRYSHNTVVYGSLM